MKIIHLTSVVVLGASGFIIGIFINPINSANTSLSEGILLGTSAGIAVGSIICLLNLEFVRKGILQMFMRKSPGQDRFSNAMGLSLTSKSIMNAKKV